MTRLSDQERLLRKVPERAFTNQVVNLARMNGWLVHHSRTALMRSGRWATALQGHAGLPDLIMVRAPRVIFAELKPQVRRDPTPGQTRWLLQLQDCPGVESYLWRPSDLQQIAKLLGRA